MKKLPVVLALLGLLAFPVGVRAQKSSVALQTQAKTLSDQLLTMVAQHPCPKPSPNAKSDSKEVGDFQTCISAVGMAYVTNYAPQLRSLLVDLKASGFDTRELEDRVDLMPHNNFTITFVAQALKSVKLKTSQRLGR